MNNILLFFDGFTLLTLVKVLIVILLGIYVIIAGLMVTQVGAMNRSIVIRDGFIMKILSWVHFVFALLIFLMAILA
jgi:hypothetical protein